MAEKKLELSMLCDVYGSLLSDNQKNAVDLYCNEDYSLSEIAEHMGISRQGVRDQIKHAEIQLRMYEEKLGLLEKTNAVSEILEKISLSAGETDKVLQGVGEIQDILSF